MSFSVFLRPPAIQPEAWTHARSASTWYTHTTSAAMQRQTSRSQNATKYEPVNHPLADRLLLLHHHRKALDECVMTKHASNST